MSETASTNHLTQTDYETLGRFRLAIRHYLAFAEQGAKSAGLTSQQHQALLIIKTQSYSRPVTVGDVAGLLLVKPHSAAELINRLAANSLITRQAAPDDRRQVHVRLTMEGERSLAQLTTRNLQELRMVSTVLNPLLDQLQTFGD